jgi:hypothetical protein
MRVRTLIMAVAAAGLAACGAPDSANPASSSAGAPRFVGLWAVSEALCAEPAWRFAPREVSTLGEVHCEFTEITPNGDRYAISGMCTAEAPPAPYAIELAVSENPRVMIVSGGPWAAPTRLIYCAPLPAE